MEANYNREVEEVATRAQSNKESAVNIIADVVTSPTKALFHRRWGRQDVFDGNFDVNDLFRDEKSVAEFKQFGPVPAQDI